MRMAKGRWYARSAALSVVAHMIVLAVLWTHAPKLFRQREMAGPPEPIIPVLILPYTPPTPPGVTEKPRPIRLHRRRLRPESAPPAEMAPLIAPRAPPSPAAPERPAAGQRRITVQPSPAGQLAAVLRAGPVGCANPALLSLEERDACATRLGRGARQAAHLPPPLQPDKQADFEAAAEARRQRAAPMPAGRVQPGATSGASNRNTP